MAKWTNLFFIKPEDNKFSVQHRQIISSGTNTCADFYFGRNTSMSKSRALKAAKIFCKQMNTYYPTKVKIDSDGNCLEINRTDMVLYDNSKVK